MANEKDKDKKFGSIKSLFFRDTTPRPSTAHAAVSGTQSPSSSSGVFDNNLIETFVKRLQDLMEKNNQPGFDFLEFTQTLFEEEQDPSVDAYKTVFRIASKMDKTLTPDKLVESAGFYKNLVQQAADAEILKGQQKKETITGEKENEVKSLKKTQKETDAQIAQLEQQIRDLQAKSATATNQLSAIDQKYDGQFADIDAKINAITAAKEQVVSSITDVQSGITNNLK